MIYQIAALIILLIFYTIYLLKMFFQKRKHIRTNQMIRGHKETTLFLIELFLSIATIVIIPLELFFIFGNSSELPDICRISGIMIGLFGDFIFGISVYTMKDSWRAGIPEEEITLVTNGIYKYSRNPAFLGFYLMYLGILLMFFHWVLFAFTAATILVFHLQVLQEEQHLRQTLGQEYHSYCSLVRRYL